MITRYTKQRLSEFLAETYRQQVFGAGNAEVLIEKYRKNADEEFLQAAQAKLAELDQMGSMVNLSQRDFVGFQNQRALRKLLARFQPYQNIRRQGMN